MRVSAGWMELRIGVGAGGKARAWAGTPLRPEDWVGRSGECVWMEEKNVGRREEIGDICRVLG